MIFDVSNNLRMLSNMSVSNRRDLLTEHVNKETLVVYDNSTNIFRPDIYNKPSIYNGTALSLISSDNSSNTFLQITTPSSKGWVLGGGVFPNDISRNMGTMGWKDNSGVYIPIQTFLSGNSLVNNRATVGINTFSPETENYSMDINGPVHLHHNEIHLIQNVRFKVNAISFCLTDTKFGVAVGTALNVNPSDGNYNYIFLYTINGGKTWNISSDIIFGFNITATGSVAIYNTVNKIVFNVFYDSSINIIVAGNNNSFFYSSNAGVSWRLTGYSGLPSSIPSVYTHKYTNVYRVYLAAPTADTSGGLWFFDGYTSATNTNTNIM
jgi:hypothetical protein